MVKEIVYDSNCIALIRDCSNPTVSIVLEAATFIMMQKYIYNLNYTFTRLFKKIFFLVNLRISSSVILFIL